MCLFPLSDEALRTIAGVRLIETMSAPLTECKNVETYTLVIICAKTLDGNVSLAYLDINSMTVIIFPSNMPYVYVRTYQYIPVCRYAGARKQSTPPTSQEHDGDSNALRGMSLGPMSLGTHRLGLSRPPACASYMVLRFSAQRSVMKVLVFPPVSRPVVYFCVY